MTWVGRSYLTRDSTGIRSDRIPTPALVEGEPLEISYKDDILFPLLPSLRQRQRNNHIQPAQHQHQHPRRNRQPKIPGITCPIKRPPRRTQRKQQTTQTPNSYTHQHPNTPPPLPLLRLHLHAQRSNDPEPDREGWDQEDPRRVADQHAEDVVVVGSGEDVVEGRDSDVEEVNKCEGDAVFEPAGGVVVVSGRTFNLVVGLKGWGRKLEG